MPNKFQRNPYYKDPISVNGTIFGDGDVAEGEEWNVWSKSRFPGIEPKLIRAPDSARVTIHSLKTGVPKGIRDDRRFAPQPEDNKPKPDSLSATVLAMDAEREAAEAKELEEAAEPVPEPSPVVMSPATVIEPEPELVKEMPPRMVPEHDSAPSMLSIPSAEPRADAPEPGDLTQISGVGDRTAAALKDVGYDTIQALADADPNEMSKAVRASGTKMSLGSARGIVRKAKALTE